MTCGHFKTAKSSYRRHVDSCIELQQAVFIITTWKYT